MALSKDSVYEVVSFFATNFPFSSIGYTGRNKYGADEVYICTDKILQTNELDKIVKCSKKIGNTVSIIPQTKEVIMICFW